jgi:general secretion pathway protein K
VERIRKMLQRSRLLRPVSNNRGMAMMLALSTMALIIYLAVEIMYDTTVEYNVNSQELNRLKAYYAARGAVEIGLLRIKIYQTVKTKLGAAVKNNPYIDQIWSFPFQWPFPTEMVGAVDKDDAKEKVESSLMDAQFSLTITDEGSKIDINDLISPSETLRKNTERMLTTLFDERIKNDDQFRKEYGTFKFEDLINAMKDWMSPRWQSYGNGDKRGAYSEFQTDQLPPNRGFRTLGELRMIPYLDDRLYELLEPRITIYGLKGVNPNTATSEALQSLDPGITKEVAQQIIQQRDKDPFSDGPSFFSFVAGKAAQRLVARGATEWPLTFDTMTSFRIVAQGDFGSVSRKITAIVMDINRTSSRIKEFVDKEKADQNNQTGQPGTGTQTGTQTGAQTQKAAETISKGPPRIVYWYEQ